MTATVKPRPRSRRVREGSAAPRWLAREVLELVHASLLRDHGGSPGIRDRGLMESALSRARNKWAYGEQDVAALGAAYAFGIAKNHPFVDGNKRTAFQAMFVFLGLNGFDLVAPEPEVVDVTNRLAAGKLSEAALAARARAHLVAIR